jgi:NAD(P)-dependent dehydrogenase (short-subunit alcohol dehydrogenase family)
MLTGKTALITGGSSGIGLASAQKLAANGARVAITGASIDKLSHAREILGDGHLAIQADVCSAKDRTMLRDRIGKEFGSLDILFANAGIAYATPIGATDEGMFDGLMNVNVKGVFFTIQDLLPLMSSGSSIILNTSWLNQVGLPGRAVLAASKAAVRSFARTLSAELLERKIRVNAVSPGSIETPIHRRGQSDDEFEAYKSRVGAQAPIGRMGQPDEIAGAVLFLASHASSYMLGAEMVIDGGRADL